MQNPYIALLRIAWTYARHEKRQYLLTYFLFILVNIVAAVRPLLFGWFVVKLQQRDTAILQLVWRYAVRYLGLELLAWTFHGPARIMERRLAFNLSCNFLDELFHQTLHLPVGRRT